MEVSTQLLKSIFILEKIGRHDESLAHSFSRLEAFRFGLINATCLIIRVTTGVRGS